MKCIKIPNCFSCPYMNKKDKTCSTMELDYNNKGVDVSAYSRKYPVFCPLDFYPGYKKLEQQIVKRNEKLKSYKMKKKNKFYTACIGIERSSNNG